MRFQRRAEKWNENTLLCLFASLVESSHDCKRACTFKIFWSLLEGSCCPSEWFSVLGCNNKNNTINCVSVSLCMLHELWFIHTNELWLICGFDLWNLICSMKSKSNGQKMNTCEVHGLALLEQLPCLLFCIHGPIFRVGSLL